MKSHYRAARNENVSVKNEETLMVKKERVVDDFYENESADEDTKELLRYQ